MAAEGPAATVRVLVVGNHGVGKSSLVAMLRSGEAGASATGVTTGCDAQVAVLRSASGVELLVEFLEVGGHSAFEPIADVFMSFAFDGAWPLAVDDPSFPWEPVVGPHPPRFPPSLPSLARSRAAGVLVVFDGSDPPSLAETLWKWPPKLRDGIAFALHEEQLRRFGDGESRSPLDDPRPVLLVRNKCDLASPASDTRPAPTPSATSSARTARSACSPLADCARWVASLVLGTDTTSPVLDERVRRELIVCDASAIDGYIDADRFRAFLDEVLRFKTDGAIAV